MNIIENLAYGPLWMKKEFIQHARLHYWLAQHYERERDLKKANEQYRLALYGVENAGLDLSLRRWVKVEENGNDSDTKLVDGEKLETFITHVLKNTR